MHRAMGLYLARAFDPGAGPGPGRPRRPRRHRVRSSLRALVVRWAPWAGQARRDAEHTITRHVVDPGVPMDELALARLRELSSCRHRAALAKAVRRNMELGESGIRLAPPVAGLLARNRADAARVAAGLESDDPDPRAVMEVQRLLENPKPTQDRLAWIARVLAPDAS